MIFADGDTDPAGGAAVVDVNAVEFAFNDLPDSVGAGPVALRFTNAGLHAHMASLGKLGEGTTLEEAMEYEGDPYEDGLIEDVGTVLIPTPGDVRVINADLTPGTYGLVCFIPGAEGTPHAFLGMSAEFTVS